MKGATALVFGATGNVGFGAATAFLHAGATVIAPTRSLDGADRLSRDIGAATLHPVVGDVSDPVDAERLRDAILDAHGPLDHVVVSLGPWWQGGALAAQSPAEWSRVRAMLLDGHVHAAELFLSLLENAPAGTNPSYTIITGMGAHHVVPGNQPVAHRRKRSPGALTRPARGAFPGEDPRQRAAHRHADRTRVASGRCSGKIFGKAPVAIAAANVRSRVLEYRDPSFSFE